MLKLFVLLIACISHSAASAQIHPRTEAVLSSTQLIEVKRLKSESPDQGPDGLSFCFLVSRTATAQHQLAIKETSDFIVSKRSYREETQAALGRVFAPRVAVHDAAKYAADHPTLASAIAAAPKKSLVVVVALAGTSLDVGSEVEVRLHVGFGRTAGKPESEDLIFHTKVPSQPTS